MKIENILEVEQEAKRLLKRIKDVKNSETNSHRFESNGTHSWDKITRTSKETGALKRASIDLTRALSKMRNNIYD